MRAVRLEAADAHTIGCESIDHYRELIGREPIGVLVTSMDEILALDADCVVYAPLVAVVDDVLIRTYDAPTWCATSCHADRRSSYTRAAALSAA